MRDDSSYEKLNQPTEEYAVEVSRQRMGSIDQLLNMTVGVVQSLSEKAAPVVDRVRVPKPLPDQPVSTGSNVIDLEAIRAELEAIQADSAGNSGVVERIPA